ncbi:otoferlin [Homalodisca vitripennis]|uniref:otoferlin n=1 Tax=Homalodisca vitripennis TaxID=197043 RepID=UPI001EEB5608|nr:otoferlin [Homalodisca vitripennis]
MPDLIPLIEIDEYSRASSLISQQKRFMKSPVAFFRSLKSWLIYLKSFLYTVEKKVEKILDDDKNDEDHDWWYKYFSGILAKYTNKLEDQKEYGGFNDVLRTFIITRKTAEFEREVAKLKVLISLYRWPVQDNVVTPRGEDPTMGVLKQNELSDRVKLLVRVYCVKAFDLHPADPNGKADPYIEVATPSNVVSDKLNYVPNQLNPVFGRCLEIAATFPVDTMLAIRVMDWDRLTKHDLIGETIIDLENRFYSKHRGTCGLASKYSTSGCNSWRDVEKPTEILERLCNTYNLPLPQYYSKSVLVACKEFVITDVSENAEETKERLALKALHHWHELPVIGKHLVTEHVETRSLFKREKPGLEQGKLELWVDLFDLSMGQIPLPINITPRKPQSYELRVVILNTSQVPLVDDSYFVGRKSTDIFVKGWLWDSNDVQMTDVHYNSINGEGNFNWRFIFQFQYYRSEKVMMFYKKRVWDLATTEVKVPPLLHLQVWDRDRLSSDDFIGDMVIELNKMPRGARSVKTCKLRTPLTPFQGVDLFKVKRMRGWWPFIREKTDKTPTYGGFLEAEFHLMTDEEALARPAGMGRSEPMALPPPMRPEFRTKFWLAPFRILTHLICKVHRKKFIFGLLICASTLFVLVGVYSIPMFVMKKLLGAK